MHPAMRAAPFSPLARNEQGVVRASAAFPASLPAGYAAAPAPAMGAALGASLPLQRTPSFERGTQRWQGLGAWHGTTRI